MEDLKCSLTVESSDGAANRAKLTVKNASLSLRRNEFREVILCVDSKEKRLKYSLKNAENLAVHRKFVHEGKLTLTVKSAKVNLMISNAPHHSLVKFAKTMAAKLATEQPKKSRKDKLMSALPNALDDISPVTLTDVKNWKKSEKGGNGLLKMKMADSPIMKKPLKRISLEYDEANKENYSHEVAKKSRDLTAEQKFVLNEVKKGANVFFTGGAGVGKSFLIKKIIGLLPPESTVVTASTGVAAFHIGGITLHSFAGMKKRVDGAAKTRWKKCKHLIIDEISMVDGGYFDQVEEMARKMKNNEKPFGGIQLILSGDFLQLPPVGHKHKRVFCFETSAWAKCVSVNIELTTVKRQTDQSFVDILKQLRRGECSKRTAEILQATRHNELVLPTKLCTHTDDANNINRSQLESLEGQGKVFRAEDSDPALTSYLDSHTPVEARLELKIGAQVMLLKNLNLSKGLVNGARGKIVGFDKVNGNPVVKFVSTKETIMTEKWTVTYGGSLTLRRKQLPLKLAWAFSIHKSQGMTLDGVEMSLSRVFECGQAYVALSRAKSLDSVRITDFSPKCITADEKVLKFYRNLKFTSPLFQTRLV